MRKHKSLGLKKQMLIKSVVPMLLLTIVITIVAFKTFTGAMDKEVVTELLYVCNLFQEDFEREYPGDMTKEGTTAITIYKGDKLLNDRNELLDTVKNLCDIDITVFYGDLRVLTTIRDNNGDRIYGTFANTKVKQDVLDNSQGTFYNNATVNDVPFYGYYKPMYNSDGTCVGMIFAGKESQTVFNNIIKSVLPIFLAATAGMIIAGMYTAKSSDSIVRRIVLLQKSLMVVSKGKLDKGIDSEILKKDDEISDIGRSVMNMQIALKELVELDALTRIYNRRSGENKLKNSLSRASTYNTPISIAIGDIDYFKKVNDTYGHDAGDIVLQHIAAVLKNGMTGHGYVVRWGGEEFLFVFDKDDYNTSVEVTKSILDSIRELRININDAEIKVTMTIGIIRGDCSEETRIMFNRADTLLYSGKNNGRNQVVSDGEEEIG